MMSRKLLLVLVNAHSGWVVVHVPGVEVTMSGVQVSPPGSQKTYPKEKGNAPERLPLWYALVLRSCLFPMLWPTSWMNTDSHPETQPVTREYMCRASGDVLPTQARPLPPNEEPSRRSETRSAPAAMRCASMPANTPVPPAPAGVIAFNAMESEAGSE